MHLTTASQGHAPTAPKTKPLSKPDSNNTSAAEQTPATNKATVQQTVALNTTDPPAAQATADNEKIKKDGAKNCTTGVLTSDTAINIAVGTAQGEIASVPLTSVMGFTHNQNSAKVQDSEAFVSQRQNTVTSAGNGIKGAALTIISASQLTEPTVSKNDAAPGPASSINSEQPQSEKNVSGLPVDSALHPLLIVSFVSDTGSTNETTDKLEQTAAATQTAVQQNATQQGADQVIQNQYGQIITIYQANTPGDRGAVPSNRIKPLKAGTHSQTLDANNNFIRSHTSENAPNTVEKENSDQQQDTAKNNQLKSINPTQTIINGQLQTEQLASQNSPITAGTEYQALTFSHQQTSTPIVDTTPIADTSTLQLPSGVTVPGETVVDQMIAHFSVNKRLESGIVNLKLNPQELGELRMEIKITQDNIKAHIIAQNPQAQEMIGLHLTRLRDALEQQGLHLQHVEVTVAANDNASREQFQDQSKQQQNQSLHNRASQSIFTLDAVEDTDEAVQAVNNLSVLA